MKNWVPTDTLVSLYQIITVKLPDPMSKGVLSPHPTASLVNGDPSFAWVVAATEVVHRQVLKVGPPQYKVFNV